MTSAQHSETHYEPDLSRVRSARHFVRDSLLRWGLPGLVDPVGLMVSELVANAVRHAGTELSVRVDLSDRLVVSVLDGVTELDETPGPADSYPGHGLTIGRTLADEWGVTTTAEGKVVWFAVGLPDKNSADAGMFDLAQRRHPQASAPPSGGAAVEARARSAI
jgi:hypothetical protein